MPNESPRYFLENARNRVLAELRRKMPEQINEYLQLTAAIEAMDSTDAGPDEDYRSIARPLDAIEAVLDNTWKASTREQIAEKLAQAGWGEGRIKRPYWNLLSIMNYYLTEYKGPPRIKQVHGLIGKADWGEEMFTEEKDAE